MEPIQPFVLYWSLWPRHEDGDVTWFEDDDDGLPVEVARFRVAAYDGSFTRGTLEIRRDRLLAFCSRFDFDVAIYDEQNVEAPDLDEGWSEAERDDALLARLGVRCRRPPRRPTLHHRDRAPRA